MTMRKIKKLKKHDINKNNSVEIKHTINKIKEQEEKYTIILVVFFMILFCFVGYFTLYFNKGNYNSNDKSVLSGVSITSSSEILLTKNHKMEDWLGVNSDVYSIEISNSQSKKAEYKLIFNSNDVGIGECECNNETFKIYDVKYSLDGENINHFDNDKELVVKTGVLEANETEVINIRMWIDSSAKIESDIVQHLHGNFSVEKR